MIRWWRPFLLILILATVAASVLYGASRPVPDEYVVVLDYIPQRLTPRQIRVSTDFMIASHLYFPLFEISDKNELVSEFFDMNATRALDLTFSTFQLCLKPDLYFSNSEPISSQHVVRALSVSRDLGLGVPSLEARVESELCLSLKLTHGDSHIFHKLASMAVTPLHDENSAIPVGFGPYELVRASEKEILLQARPDAVKGTFKRVRFVNRGNEVLSRPSVVLDLNYLTRRQRSKAETEGKRLIQRPSFKTYAVVVNYLDEGLRKKFAQCFPRQAFSRLLTINLKPIPGFLPEGTLGWNVRFGEQEPRSKDCAPVAASKLRLLHFENENYTEIVDFFKEYASKLPIPVEVQKVDVSTFVKEMYTSSNTASLVGFDAVSDPFFAGVDGLSYLDPFVDPQRNRRLVTHPDGELVQLRAKVQQASDTGEREQLLKAAHAALLRSGHVIPVGELKIVYAYPPEISNIVWLGEGYLSGFPDISKMKWSAW